MDEYDKQRDIEAEGQRAAVYHNRKTAGDFDAALRKMIRNLQDEKPHQDILAEWDAMRGTDWFTGTKSSA